MTEIDVHGTVAALWRHPVKSMLGESVTEVAVDQRGVAGDRRWALLDTETGRVASVKRPRRWGAILACRSELAGSLVRITLPDGTTVRSTDRRVDDRLSAVTGRRVTLVDQLPLGAAMEKELPAVEGLLPPDSAGRAHPGEPGEVLVEGPIAQAAPPGTFVDFAPVHLVTTATLRRLGTLLSDDDPVPAIRFRPNLVLHIEDDGDGDGGADAGGDWPEQAWVGRTITIGDVALRVMIPTPRCAVPALPHGDIPPDRRVLPAVATHARVDVGDLGPHGCVGVYAQVVRPGSIAVADRFSVAGR